MVKNWTYTKLWLSAAIWPLFLAALIVMQGDPTELEIMTLAGGNALACIGAASIAYVNHRNQTLLELKLKELEDRGVTFRAGYCGVGETFTALLPDGTFIDYGHWMPTGNDETVQYFKPTEFGRVVDETIKELDNYKTYYADKE